MRYNPLLHRKGRAARRGIAVMFALGILSLVIVSVLIFSHRAVTDRKVAAAYAGSGSAKALAESAFGRALVQLQKNTSMATAFYSGGKGDDDFDWLWKLDEACHILPRDKTAPVRWQYVYGSDGHIVGRYAYIIVGETRPHINAMLDHQFCLVYDPAKPDESTCNGIEVNETVGGVAGNCPRRRRTGNSATELRFNYNNFSDSFDMADPSNTSARADFNVDNLQLVRSGGSVVQYQSPEDLLTKADLKQKEGADESDYNIKSLLKTYFNISRSSNLHQADAWFGGDANDNKIKDKAEFYQRFLLYKTADQWNSIGANTTTAVNEILKTATAFYEGESPKMTNSAGIPWLKNWKESSGNWPNATAKSKQIAANLINYCASETTPVVSNVNPENWYGETAVSNDMKGSDAYTGNKRTWYLNECGVVLEIDVNLGTATTHGAGTPASPTWYSFGDGGSGKTIKLAVRLHILPEIINMYGATAGGSKLPGSILSGASLNYRIVSFARMQFDYMQNMSYSPSGTGFVNNAGSYTGSYQKSFNSMGSSLFNVDGTKPASDADKVKCQSTGIIKDGTVETYATFAFGKTGVYYIEDTIDITGSFASSNANPTNDELKDFFKVKNINLSNLAMFLKTEGLGSTDKVRYVDCSILPTVTSSAEQSLPANASTTPAVSKYLSVDDPRNNLHEGDWVEAENSLGSVNKNVTCKNVAADYAGVVWTRDPETAEDPANKSISTAYIRHAPIQSLWELGVIHRAAPWQTLNFKKPKPSSSTDAERLKADNTTKGGGAYDEGDFPILDQVTMQGGSSYTPIGPFGKINLNVQNSKVRQFAFGALTQGLYWSPIADFRNFRSGHQLKTQHTNELTKYLGVAPDNIKLFNRSDIYLTPSDKTEFWKLFEKSAVRLPYDAYHPTTGNYEDLKTDALQEQTVCRFIGLTTANATSDSAEIIVLAQTIKDVGGGATILRDWGEDGTISSATSNQRGSAAAMQRAGYRYWASTQNKSENTLLDSFDPEFFDRTKVKLYDTFTAEYGRYDNGADKITGETKMVAQVQYDQTSGKWKIVQVKYEAY